MRLHELIEGLPLRLAGGGGDLVISDLTDDSRMVVPGGLFIARPGTKADGRTYIHDAMAKGAVAVLVQEGQGPTTHGRRDGPPHTTDVAWVVGVNVDQSLCGQLAERFFGYPSRKLALVGITGTKGKTTTAFLVQHLLRAAGVPCGMIGTVFIDDGKSRETAALTTPGAIEFSRLLSRMVANGCKAAVAEFSSHALHQGRVAALKVDVAVFTNLTGDHLDYHGTMEAYADAKAILFEGLAPSAWAVVNVDDPWADRMVRNCRAHVVETRVTADCQSPTANCAAPGTRTADDEEGHLAIGNWQSASAQVLALAADHSLARLDGLWGSAEVRLPLVGRHNVANVLQAVAAANCVADIPRTPLGALETFPGVPGRLEVVGVRSQDSEVKGVGVGTSVPMPGAPQLTLGAEPETRHAERRLPTVIVDYAHTHDALEKVLQALRPTTRGRLIVMFGCGGDRDRTKRPKMGDVACRLADRVVVTSDNPRTEDPLAIIDEILKGVPAGWAIVRCQPPKALAAAAVPETRADATGSWPSAIDDARVLVEPDRGRAIALAIESAGPDDVVLLAGKGHEDYQIIGTQKRHFDDREEAAKALRRMARCDG